MNGVPIRIATAFAHPDDETFSVGGSMVRAAEEGALLTAICATRGEVGEIADPSLATPETLGSVRESELRRACHVLGCDDVRFLDYRDSGMQGTKENADPRAFANIPDEAVADRLVALFREIRPDVVVTFEPGGAYGHPDHIKISRCATLAFDRAAIGNWAPRRLFYAGPSRSGFKAMQKLIAATGAPVNAAFLKADLGIPDEDITTIVDVTAYFDRKQAAFAEHRTQQNPLMRTMPEETRRQMLTRENFTLARGALSEGARRDLIADL